MAEYCEHRDVRKTNCCGGGEKSVPWCNKYQRACDDALCDLCMSGQSPMTRMEKISSIASGYVGLAAESIGAAIGVSSVYSTTAESRINICRQCELRTYLSILEYNGWIKENGGYARFIQEVHGLDAWPDLPDNKDENNGEIFCRKCKCLLRAKAYSLDEKCPIGNPAWLSTEQEQENG